MTLKELKEKCISKGRKIIKISEKPARMYKVSYRNGNGKYIYRTYVRRKCSICKKEVMKDIETYKRDNINPISGKCMFGKPQRSFCSQKCRAKGVSGKKHYMYHEDKVYYRKKDGYAMQKRYNHPNKNNQNLVTRSRLVVEENIGRYLKPYDNGRGEMVHHINMSKADDSYENLMLCSNASEHLLVHGTYNKLCKPLMDAGFIQFDEKKGYYLTKEFHKTP